MPFPARRADRSGHTERRTETSALASPSRLASVSVERVSPACPLPARFRCLQLPFRFSRSGIFIQAALSSSYSCTFTFSPFAPRSLPASPLLWAVRLPRISTRGSPRFLDPSFLTRRPQPPRRVRLAASPASSPLGGRLHPFGQTGHSHLNANEAESGSLSLRLTSSPCKASCRGLLPFHTLARLR